MKTTYLYPMACGLTAAAGILAAAAPVYAQEPFTFETPARLFSTADLNGDGRLDAVVLDRETGAAAMGFQDAAGAYTWSEGLPTGAEAATCLTVGRQGSVDLFGVTTPALGRLVFVSSASSSAEPVVTNIFPKLPSPQAMAFFPLTSTTAPELLVTGDRGTGVGNRYGYELRPPLTGPATPLWEQFFNAPTSKIASIRVKTGTVPRVLEYFGSSCFCEGVSLTALTAGPGGLGGAITDPATTLFAVGNFDGTAYTQFLFYDPGTSAVRTVKITEPSAGTYGWSALTTFSFPQNINLLVPLAKSGGGLRLGVIFSDGSASLYDYSGAGVPTLNRTLSPPGSAPADVLLPSGPDAVLIARGGSWQRFLTGVGNPATPQFTGVFPLPGVAAGTSNVIYLTSEAFAKTDSTLTGTGKVREWTTAATGSGTTWSITSLVTAGASGLGSPAATSRTAPAGTTTTMLNQVRSNVSIQLADGGTGIAVGDVAIAPPGGVYHPGAQPPGPGAPAAWITGTAAALLPPALKYDQDPTRPGALVQIPPWLTISLNPTRQNNAVWYRINDGAWTRIPYQGQIELYANVVIESYATSGTSRSPIRRQAYTFAAPAALATAPGVDSDGNSLTDQWEKTFGAADPGADADGDGYSNYAEFAAGTDPRSQLSQPAAQPLVLNGQPATGSGGEPVLRLEWAAADASLMLESASNLTGPWSPITTGITLVSGNNRYDVPTVPQAQPKNFFRLRRP